MIRVIKIGGSLLDFADLETKTASWLGTQSLAQNVFIAGGGQLVDCLRQWQKTFQLSDEQCHMMCFDLMAVSSRLLAEVLDCELAESISEIADRPNVVLSPTDFTPACDLLESSWDVTSDSFAASVANVIGASELVLFKSITPMNNGVDDWCRRGIVDRAFSHHADGIPLIRIVNPRQQQGNTVTAHGRLTDHHPSMRP